jgi:putative MATE family efflux protein
MGEMSNHTLRTESLFRLSWPIFLQHATGALALFVDFVFLSYISDEVAGIVGQILPVTWLGSFIIPVFASTGISVSSQFMGARRYDKVVPTYMMNLALSFGLGLLIATGMFVARGHIGLWMGMTESQNEVSTVYLGWMSGYFVVMSVMVAYNAVLSSRGLTQWIMLVSLVSGVTNIGLNTWFVFGLGWGVVGIVGSTIIATACSMCIGMVLVHGRLKIRYYLKGALRDMLSVLRPMMRVGIPNVLEPMSYACQQIVLSTFVISMGVQSMAANAFSGRLHMPHIVLCFSMAAAAQILMAHWMGAGKTDRINRLFWRIFVISVVAAWAYMTVIWLNAYEILRIFTEDPEIRALGKKLLLISLVTEPARMVNILSGSCLRSVGDTRYPMVVGLIFIWGILPVIFVLDNMWHLTIVGMWACFAVDEFLRALVNLQRWHSGKWKRMGLVEPAPDPDVGDPHFSPVNG